MLTLVAALTILVYGLTSPLLGVLLPSYSLSLGQQGSLGLTNALGLAIASLSAGPLVDYKGKKLALLIGLSLIFLGLIAVPSATSYSALLAVYFTIGFGGGTVTTGVNSLVGDLSGHLRGSALNFVNLFFGLGGIVTTYLASYRLHPARLCYSIAALALLAMLANLSVSVTDSPAESEFRLTLAPRLISNPTLLLLSLLLFFYVACEVGVWNWLKAYLISIRYPAQTAGGIVSYGFGLGMLLGRLAASRILLKSSAIHIILAAGILITLTTFTLLQLNSPATVTLAVFAAGFCMAPVFPTVLALVSGLFRQGTATAMGIAITCGWLGLAVSSPIIGALAEKTRLGYALLLLPVSGILMVLVTLVLKARLRLAPVT